jgi:hypothetical protein
LHSEPERFVEILILATLDRILHSVVSQGLWESKAKSSVDAGAHHRAVRELENPFVAVIPVVKNGFARGAIAAADYAAGGVNGPEPYNAVPIPSLHLVDCLHPFRRKLEESYTVESPH